MLPPAGLDGLSPAQQRHSLRGQLFPSANGLRLLPGVARVDPLRGGCKAHLLPHSRTPTAEHVLDMEVPPPPPPIQLLLMVYSFNIFVQILAEQRGQS